MGRAGWHQGPVNADFLVTSAALSYPALQFSRRAPALPELPEVETTMRALEKRLTGRQIRQTIQRRGDLRFPLPPELPARLEGQKLISFDRRAKYIRIALDGGLSMILHLGMSGRLLFDGEEGRSHEHLTFTFDDGTILRYIDPRRFGMLDLHPTHDLGTHRWFAHLGFEPFDAIFNAKALKAAIANKHSAIKTAIMDQRVVVGVGNIYASESLFRAKILPTKLAADLTTSNAKLLATNIKQVLLDAINAGGSSLRDYVQSSGELGNFQSFFNVYGREDQPCTRCSAPIRRIVQTGRATFFCPKCQR